MALEIFVENLSARKVYDSGLSLNARLEVGMGGYAVAIDGEKPTALGTCGAGPCQIIVVHKKAGCGALGHYAADGKPASVAKGVQAMVARVGGAPVEAIVLAAGVIDKSEFDTEEYKPALLKQLGALFPTIHIVWQLTSKNEPLGACYYLPGKEQVGFFTEAPGGFTGMAKPKDGVTLYSFGFS